MERNSFPGTPFHFLLLTDYLLGEHKHNYEYRSKQYANIIDLVLFENASTLGSISRIYSYDIQRWGVE